MNQPATAMPAGLDASFASLSDQLEAAMAEHEIPGAVLGIFHRDQVRTAAFGIADLSTAKPVTTDTVFRVASLTKIFTTTGVMSYADGEERSVAAPVSSWYPAFRLADTDASASITLAQVLSHSAGWVEPAWPEEPDEALTLEDLVTELENAPQYFTPGTLFNYSNYAYLLAGQILASLNGQSYEEALAQRVFGPLDLQSTGFFREQFSDRTVAAGHTTGSDGLEVRDPWYVHPATQPPGGILSTVDDLVRFLQFHAGILLTDVSPLTSEQRLAMQVPHGPGGSLGPIVADNIGLGWMRTQIGGRQLCMSFGSDAGVAAAMAFAPDDEFGFVMLSNADPGLVVSVDVLTWAVELVLNTTEPDPLPVTLAPEVLQQSTGTYTIPGDLTFELSIQEDALWLTASMGGEPLPGFTGPLTMLSADSTWFDLGPTRIVVDLVRDESGRVAWLRFAARLAHRIT